MNKTANRILASRLTDKHPRVKHKRVRSNGKAEIKSQLADLT